MEDVDGAGDLLRSECGNDVVDMEHVFPPKRTSSDGQCDQSPTEGGWCTHVHQEERFYSFQSSGMYIRVPPADCKSLGSLLWLSNHDICQAIG